MSDLTDRIAAEHVMYRRTVSDTNLAGVSIAVYTGHECSCGWETTDSRTTSAHVAEVTEAAVLARIATGLLAERDHARRAHQAAATQVDHLAHDYCRWVGHAEALTNAAKRVARGGAV